MNKQKGLKSKVNGYPYLCTVGFDTIDNVLSALSPLSDKKLLLAHSGGIDSSVLAHLLLKKKTAFSVAHCNFQLRGSESEADQAAIENWCKKHQVPFFCKRIDLIAIKKKNKKGTQEAARTARYDWFEELRLLHQFDILVTAHHLNDQFESFLMYTTRGTGLSGLLGIQQRDWIQRPLQFIEKKEIKAYAEAHNIKWREDASNATTDYLRNEFRHLLIAPWLQKHPEALTNFKTTLRHLRATNSFIESQLNTLKNELFQEVLGQIEISITAYRELPQLSFCTHHWFSPLGFETKEVLKLIEAPKGKQLLSHTHRLIRERDKLVLTPLQESTSELYFFDLEAEVSTLPFPLKWNKRTAPVSQKWQVHQAALDFSKLKMPLCLRKFQKGDYFYPSGMKGKKLLSKYFKDEHYTVLEKESQWLLCSLNQIVWVVGKRCDARFAASDQTKEILLIETIK